MVDYLLALKLITHVKEVVVVVPVILLHLVVIIGILVPQTSVLVASK